MTAAIFIDRDGVIIEDPGYACEIEDLKLIPDAIKGLKLLNKYELFIITNQSGIGRGLYSIEDFLIFNGYLIKQLKKHNIKIQKTYCCPHKPEDSCSCRKPKTRFLKDAEKEFKLDLKKSFVIGDKKIDIELGKNAGCKSVLVMTGQGKLQKKASADYTAKSLLEAAQWINKKYSEN